MVPLGSGSGLSMFKQASPPMSVQVGGGRVASAGSVLERRGVAAKRQRFVIGLVLASTVWVSLARAKQAVVWIDSYKEAIEEARRTQKPIFLEFRCAP